jgi:hypothetical protein
MSGEELSYDRDDEILAEALCLLVKRLLPGTDPGLIYPYFLQYLAESGGTLNPDDMESLAQDILDSEGAIH